MRTRRGRQKITTETRRKMLRAMVLVNEDGCWVWQGRTNDSGYGEWNHEGKGEATHRISWRLHRGAIPDGMWVLHSCDNPPCCNPAHLFLGTALDNSLDRYYKGRHTSKKSRSVVRLGKPLALRLFEQANGPFLSFIATMREEKQSWDEIAERVGVDRTTVWRWIQVCAQASEGSGTGPSHAGLDPVRLHREDYPPG